MVNNKELNNENKSYSDRYSLKPPIKNTEELKALESNEKIILCQFLKYIILLFHLTT